MKAAALRMTLAALLLATVVSKTHAPRVESNLDAGVLATLAHYGLSPQHRVAEQDSALPSSIYFEAPGCDGAVQVMPIQLNLQEAPLLSSVGAPNYDRHFIYLDRSWQHPDRLGMRLVWLKYKALSLLGLSPYVPTTLALLVAEPHGCEAAEMIDWRTVWQQQNLKPVPG
jgi:hypothetical protein